jgi:hypothetical protein
VSAQLTNAETVLEALGQGIIRIGQRPETLAQIAHRRDLEHRAKSPR